jgi:hypothetical protein
MRILIALVAASLILDASFAGKAHVPKPEFKGGEWPCPFWKYQQIGQPVMYYSLADPNASVDALCTAKTKREGRE